MNDLRSLARFHDEDLHGMESTAGARTLLDEITAIEPHRPRVRRSRRLIFAASLAAAASAATVAGLLIPGMSPVDRAEAMTITDKGDYYEVIITDPYADKKKFDQEFRERGWDIDLKLIPASRPLVGDVNDNSGRADRSGIKFIDTCPPGYTKDCRYGFKVPEDFTGKASFEIGRPARPGEQYTLATIATDKGEPLEGVKVKGRTLREIEAKIRKRGLKVDDYMQAGSGNVRVNMVRHELNGEEKVDFVMHTANNTVSIYLQKTD